MEGDKYQLEEKGLYFKHAVSAGLPCSAYSKHAHNIYELLYFVSGDATLVIEDRRYKLKSGDLVVIPPRKYHFVQIDAPSDYERYDILFDNRLLNIESIWDFAENIEIINLQDAPLGMSILQKTDYYYQNLDAEDFVKVMTHLISELFYVIRLSPRKHKIKQFTVTSPLLSKALCYINENLVTLFDVEQVAKECFVSKSYLFRLFKKELLQTPKQYITGKRLLLAQSKIADGEKPTQVYAACGFGDYATFYRNFVDFFGYPPSKTQVRIKLPRTN